MRRLVSFGGVTALAAIGGILAVGQASTIAQGTASLPTISITMDGSSIAVSGALQSGGVDIHSTATRPAGAEPTLVRLNPGATMAQLQAVLASKAGQDPNNVASVGSIVFDADAPKGTSDAQTTLAAGNYVALDTVGSNPAKFPVAAVTIADAAAPAVLPTPAATIRAEEFSFTGPTTLKVGELVRFQNDGFLVHMIVAIRAKNTAGAKKIISALHAGKDKQLNKLAIGGAGFLDPVSHGAAQQLTITAAPGVYVLACFMDTQDRREHTRLGMLRLIHIVK
jgi:hypothetical protein